MDSVCRKVSTQIQAPVSKKHLFIVNNCHTHSHMLGGLWAIVISAEKSIAAYLK